MDKNNIKTNKSKVHGVLAQSYFVFFVFFLVGVYLDMIFKFQIFTNLNVLPIGFVFIFLASILVFWSQKTGSSLKTDSLSKDTFIHGPYKYTRSPTHLGLFLLMIGFGIIANASFVVLFTLIAFLFSKFFFLAKQEDILTQKYGDAYLEYKKLVRF
jgi:protein-S-isoprenylcysteine O-methyltransferase Ste14